MEVTDLAPALNEKVKVIRGVDETLQIRNIQYFEGAGYRVVFHGTSFWTWFAFEGNGVILL